MKHRLALALLMPCFVACGGGSPSGPTPPNQPPVGGDVVFVGAGDIGWCGGGPQDTGVLLDRFPDAVVFTTGDNAYPDGSVTDYQNCYDPFWGRFKDRTRPTAGNHEYHTDGGTPYFNYFGENAGPYKRGYYSYTLGTWHAVALDSNVSIG